MKSKGKVLIIYNKARSCENRRDYEAESSVAASAKDICRNLSKRNYSCKLLSVSSPLSGFFLKIKDEKPNFIFNLCEGFDGNPKREMNIAAMLELIQIPYTGCSPKTLVLAQDKYRAKMLAKIAGISTPDFQMIYSLQDKLSLKFPVFLKPPFEDGSIGISEESYVKNLSELEVQAADLIMRYGSPIMAEEYIDGREFNVAAYGGYDDIRILPPSEIIFKNFPPTKPKITTYKAKWNENSEEYRNTESVCPAQIGEKLLGDLKDITMKLCRLFEADSYSRADFRINNKGKIQFIEFNPNPDISPSAGFRKALAAENIDFANFAEALLECAKRRFL